MFRVHHMYDTVHLDEKWFKLYKANTKYYLAKDEDLPYRSCPNKRYIGKVMFLAAVARPRYDFRRKRHFDGKIGIWYILEKSVAQRRPRIARRAHQSPKTSPWHEKYTPRCFEKTCSLQFARNGPVSSRWVEALIT
jgi:hypothetical protein